MASRRSGRAQACGQADAPEKTLPRQPLDIPVQVAGAGAGEEAYVTVAAVDVGILNLTRYQPPNPDDWYFGQRQLGLEIRDLYGRLIDGSLGATGKSAHRRRRRRRWPCRQARRRKSWSPSSQAPSSWMPTARRSVSFDIPQFNGTARIMAVAWSKAGVGHATQDVIIRDPVVVTASLPNFLAPGDKANCGSISPTPMRLRATTRLQSPATMPSASMRAAETQTISLQAGGKYDVTLPLTGLEPGAGHRGNQPVECGRDCRSIRSVDLPVRPAHCRSPNGACSRWHAGSSLTVNGDLLADSVLARRVCQRQCHALAGLRHSGAVDEPRPLSLWLRRTDGEPARCRCSISAIWRARTALPTMPILHKRVQDAIYRVLSYQSSTGSFGLWGPGSGDLWLDAYVTDFLTRAREQKYDVPDQAMVQALDNLQNALSATTPMSRINGNEIAYALYVLARNKRAAVSDLRYYADTMLNDFPTPLAKAHLAAALALYGDAQRSAQHLCRCLADGPSRRRTRVSFVALRLRLVAARRCRRPGACRRKPPGAADRPGTGEPRCQGMAEPQIYQHPGTGLDAAGRARAAKWRRWAEA